MRTMLFHALLAGLLASPAFGDITITGRQGGATVYRMFSSLPGDYGVPVNPGVVFTVTVHNGDTPPPDDPDDPDDPPDTDPLPPGKYKIQRQVRDWAKAVDHPERAATALEVAKHFRNTLPVFIKLDVDVKTPQNALTVAEMLVLSVVGTQGGAQQAWADFGGKLSARAKELIASGQVSTVDQFLEMSLEVATGLEASVSPAEKRAAILQQLE